MGVLENPRHTSKKHLHSEEGNYKVLKQNHTSEHKGVGGMSNLVLIYKQYSTDVLFKIPRNGIGNYDTLTSRRRPLYPAVYGAMGCGQKNFKLVWRCHQLLSRFLAKRQFVPSVASVTSVTNNNKVIMKWSRGLCTDLLAFALRLRKTPDNLS